MTDPLQRRNAPIFFEETFFDLPSCPHKFPRCECPHRDGGEASDDCGALHFRPCR